MEWSSRSFQKLWSSTWRGGQTTWVESINVSRSPRQFPSSKELIGIFKIIIAWSRRLLKAFFMIHGRGCIFRISNVHGLRTQVLFIFPRVLTKDEHSYPACNVILTHFHCRRDRWNEVEDRLRRIKGHPKLSKRFALESWKIVISQLKLRSSEYTVMWCDAIPIWLSSFRFSLNMSEPVSWIPFVELISLWEGKNVNNP